jgi:Glutaredoxin-like domain (DUF836)
MRSRLVSLAAAWPFDLRVVDVDADPELTLRYGDQVPLLATAEGAEICRYWLDERALGRLLGPSL